MVEELIAFSRRLLGPGADEVGQIVGDWARLWRIKNLISIKKKFERICQEQGIDPSEGRYLPLAVGLPLLEKASYQYDNYLQERWAHLIASSLSENSTSENNDFSLENTCVEILHQLSPLDCEVLEFVVENGVKDRVPHPMAVINTVPIEPGQLQAEFPDTLAHISVEKLVSLGCVRRRLILPIDGLQETIEPNLIGINLYIKASGKMPKWATFEWP